MAGSKALLVVCLIAFTNNKIINGLPVVEDDTISEDSDELSYNPVEDYAEGNIPNVVEGGINDIMDEFTTLDHEEQLETNSEGTEDTDGSDDSSVEKEGKSQDNYSSKEHKAEDKSIMINGGFSQGPGLSVNSYSVDGRTSSVTLNSSEIYAVIPGMTSTKFTMMGGRVLVGDDYKNIWSETRGEVVVVEGDKCTKILFQKRKQVSKETMSSSDCAQVLEKIQQLKKEANELSDRLSMMAEQIEQSVQRSMEQLFYPRFPSGSNINNNNGMNYNYNNSPFGNSFPFGSNNSPFGNNFPFGSNNSPFANNFPSGFNDNPFTRYSGNYGNLGSTGTYDITGSNDIYGNPSGAGFYGSTGSNGITGNAAMAGRAAIYDNPSGAGFYGSTGTYDTTGSNDIYGNPSGAGFYGSTGSNGITGNAAMAGRAAIYDNPGGAGFYPTGYIN